MPAAQTRPLTSPAALHLSPRDAVDGHLRRLSAHVYILLFTPQINASEASKRANLQNIDLGGLLGFVSGEGGVSRRRHFHREQAVARQDHVPIDRKSTRL